ncbi:MAG: hypothetical protein ACTSVV_15395 [Promethearchaeota archaeon]
MNKEGLFTTIVGSFPLQNNMENMKKAFIDEIEAGIDYVCYPQLVNMNAQFLKPLSELIDAIKIENKKFYLVDEFKAPKKLIALEYGQFIIDFFEKNPEMKSKIKGTKACLTGPFTLASELILRGKIADNVDTRIFKEPRGVVVDWIVEELAELMKNIGEAYNSMGIDIISMDEPILGVLVGRKSYFYDEDFIIEMLNKALSGIREFPSIHVCGNVSPLLRDILLKTDVKILDHEFKTNERNFEIFQRKHFENTDKYLAMGVVQTNVSSKGSKNISDYVESVEEIKNFIEKGIKIYGKENLVIKPDCGFGGLRGTFKEAFAYEIAINKLKNMVKAVKELE